jgi:predicted enzyme related to lactoylglutathione lyase
MKITEIAFSAYPVTDLAELAGFTKACWGSNRAILSETKRPGGLNTILARTLAIGNGAPDWKPSKGGGQVGLEVEDFKAAVQKLKADNCKVLVEAIETPVCFMSIISDPDGNSYDPQTQG